MAGEEGYLKTLRRTFPNEAEAQAAAEAEWKRLNRAERHMDLTLAQGRAEIIPDASAHLTGFKPTVDRTRWIIAEVRIPLVSQEEGSYLISDSDSLHHRN